MIGLHRDAIGRAHPDQARVCGADPICHQLGEQAETHVAGQDYSGQAFFLGGFLVSKATGDLAESTDLGVVTALLFGHNQIERSERVTDCELFELFHVMEFPICYGRFMKRWSMCATTSSFWFLSVERITTNTIVPALPVFS